MSEKPVNKIYPIAYFTGMITLALGALECVPMATSLLCAEWRVAVTFLLTMSVSAVVGLALMRTGYRYRAVKLSFAEGMVVAAGAWFLGTLLSALPYALSGNYRGYLDACFDVMSGLTTTGLSLIQDLDHVSNGLNMWRHVLTFVGGQGMVVLALTFLTKNAEGAYKMYVGEGKDEKLFPNAISTARRIWGISMLYLAVGTLVMSLAAYCAGMRGGRAVLHGLWIFMSAWSTGGFAPMSQNMLYYHSALFEAATVVFFVIGSFNFALHHAVLTGNRRELYRNAETVTFMTTLTALTLVVTAGLLRDHVFAGAAILLRKGFYLLISGHTTTGFMTVYAIQLYKEWGDIALFGMTVAMLLGGCACSTAGGFKALRVSIIFSTLRDEVRNMMLPPSRVSRQKIHHIRDIVLSDSAVRSAFAIVFAYIATFAAGTLAGLFAGYPLAMAAFESASVTGNVGLSAGLTTAAMPAFLKIVYIVIMWLARLEFMSVLTLVAYCVGSVKKRCD